MADTRLGLFLPGESQIYSKVQIYKGSVAGRTEPSPTEPNPERAVMSPYSEILDIIGTPWNSADTELMLEVNENTDIGNFPSDRPRVADEIKDAIRGEQMTVTTVSELAAGAHNCDKGYAEEGEVKNGKKTISYIGLFHIILSLVLFYFCIIWQIHGLELL